MISWVDGLLMRWGKWAMKPTNGYPTCVSFAREYIPESGQTWGKTSMDYCSADIIQVDKAVNLLDKPTIAILIGYYQLGISKSKLASKAGISRTKLASVMECAHLQIARNLR